MSTTTPATPETAAGSSITSDPIDSLDFGDVANTTEHHTSAIPDYMLLGENREQPVESAESEDSPERQRDETGKFAKKDEADIEKGPEDRAPSSLKPFQYRTNGETHEPEGFEYNPADGSVLVKPEAVGSLRDAMNARHLIAQGRDINEQLRSENAGLKQQLQQGSAGEAQANKLVESLTNVINIADDQEAIEAFFALRTNMPSLMAKAEADYWKQRATTPNPRGQAPPRQDNTPDARSQPVSALPSREIAVAHTQEYVEQLKLDHAFHDLSAKDWQQLDARYGRTPYAFLRPATAEEVPTFGVNEGEIVFDHDAFTADVQEFVSTMRSSRATAESKAKLAADNARRTAPTIEAPPVAGGGSTPAKTPKKITNKQEMDEWWDSTDV
jgi:hypothetical protein